MIKISRIIYAPMVLSILNLEGVHKIELLKRRQGFDKPIVRVHIYIKYNENNFRAHLKDLRELAIHTNNTKMRTIIDQSQHDGFIKETAYEEMGHSMPKKFKELCEKYSQEFFNKYGELAKLTQTT